MGGWKRDEREREREETYLGHVRISESLLELGDTELFGQLLAEDFDEDAGGGGGFFFVEVDAL